MSKTRDKAVREQKLCAEPKMLDSLCFEVASGRGPVAWCKERDVRYTQIMAWIEGDAERQRQYELALKARGATTVAQLEAVIQRTISGELDSRRAMAVTKPLQWLAAVFDRKQFGEQMRVDHKHSLADDHLAALKQQIDVRQPQEGRRTPASSKSLSTIDGEFRALPAPIQGAVDPLAALLDKIGAPKQAIRTTNQALDSDLFDV